MAFSQSSAAASRATWVTTALPYRRGYPRRPRPRRAGDGAAERARTDDIQLGKLGAREWTSRPIGGRERAPGDLRPLRACDARLRSFQDDLRLARVLAPKRGPRRSPDDPPQLVSRGRLTLAFLGVLGMGACSMAFKDQPTEYKLSSATLEFLVVDGLARASIEPELSQTLGAQEEPNCAADGAPLSTGAKLYEQNRLCCHRNERCGDCVASRSIDPVPLRRLREAMAMERKLDNPTRRAPET
jgi:hypothetical protein